MRVKWKKIVKVKKKVKQQFENKRKKLITNESNTSGIIS